MGQASWVFGVAALSCVAIVGCGDDSGPGGRDSGGDEDAAGTPDGSSRDGATGDDGASPPDGASSCPGGCDDGLFCTGIERCESGSCVAGAAPECDDTVACTTDSCSDETAACLNLAPDADGDGHGETACVDAAGAPLGDDCDDTDGTAYPGAPEICDPDHDEDCNETTVGDLDADSDGYVDHRCCNGTSCADDCDDSSADVHPTASEACDGSDNDCDGTIDEGLDRSYYRDADSDGFGLDSDVVTGSCAPPVGYALVGGDCNDADTSVNPGNPEVCNRVDDDCDGAIDDMAMEVPWYVDADMDGHGDPTSTPVLSCPPIPGRSTSMNDCDDTNGGVNPGAPEVCDRVDNDCDGDTDEMVTGTFRRDADGDGYGDPAGMSVVACMAPGGYAAVSTDCDDTRADRNPGAPEVCDTVDNDCDIGIDEGVTSRFYRDADGDGFGNLAGPFAMACMTPGGYVVSSTDCDDTRASRNPGAPEICDLLDNDCDGPADEEGGPTWYRDGDGDGYGGMGGVTTVSCTMPAGYDNENTDCDDTQSARNPSAPETCDLLDNDCDTRVDEMVGTTYYRDADSDGFGNPAGPTMMACGQPVGYDPEPTDCDDTRNTVYPMATELCDMLDNDCDGITDEVVPRTWYRDADGDGFGDPTVTMSTMTCLPPGGYVGLSGDCNDGNMAIRPGAAESCDRVDSNCTGDAILEDEDGDLRASPSAPCMGGYPKTDCVDSNAMIYGGAAETCDGVDNDCSSGGGTATDEDADGDRHSAIGASCAGGFPRDDCDDADAMTFLGAPEYCDRQDQNCSLGGGVDVAEDVDDDGHSPPASACITGPFPEDDCQDGNATIYPGAMELCDRLDNDCSSGGTTVASEDADSDMYAPPSALCSGGFPRTDCNDASSAIHPGVTDTCSDAVDTDCDGTINEDDARRTRTFTCGTSMCSREYVFCSSGLNFSNARSRCALHPGFSLVRINDAAENSYVRMQGASVFAAGTTRWFTGAGRPGAIGSWTWRDGTTLGAGGSYTNWAPGQPDNLDSVLPDCDGTSTENAPMSRSDGTWSDECAMTAASVCAAPNCHTVSMGARQYVFCLEAVDHDTARATCTAQGARMLRIDSMVENDWVRATATSLGITGFWTGAAEPSTGVWRWDDGVQFWMGDAGGMPVGGLFSYWAASEPSFSGDAAVVLASGRWDARNDAEVFPVACEVY